MSETNLALDDNRDIKSSTVEQFGQELKKARNSNRQIVPIVGAGLSADCGFPVIMSVVRYFGKLQQYIEKGAFLKNAQFLNDYFKKYSEAPWKYVEDFGWPDRFQLNQELFTLLRHALEPSGSTTIQSEKLIERAVREGLEKLLPGVNPQGYSQFRELQKDVEKKLQDNKALLNNERFNKAVKETLQRFEEHWSKSVAFDIVGDWRRLILYFTNYQSDYADALFARFGATRQPGQGHQFLSFLVKRLAIPTVFTFNFDSLIEQALEADGAQLKVFAMERGASLPHPGLVRDQLSVIKMHGSTHALLLDEQLDRPLNEEYLRRFDRITGPNPLLFVIGCSDSDRRLRDLVSHVVRASSERKNRHGHTSAGPSLLWLHYEKNSPRFLTELLDRQKEEGKRQESLLVCPTNNPGATLMHLYSWLTGCNPAGRVPYLAHVQQPIHLGKKSEEHENDAAKWGEKRFYILSSDKEHPNPPASHELLELANYWARNGYHFIWIDLEAIHTFAGIVGEIIDQCRKYNPELAPSVLPVNIDNDHEEPGKMSQFDKEKLIKLAAERVARALRQTRYFLAFDGLETYVWPATTHHGLTHMAIQRGAGARLANLCQFLEKLIAADIGESRIGISVDDSKPRHRDKMLIEYIRLEEKVKKFKKMSGGGYSFKSKTINFENLFNGPQENLPLVSLKRTPKRLSRIFAGNTGGSINPESCKARLALMLFILSCFRRTRPLVALRHLLEPLLGGEDRHNLPIVDEVLKQFTKPQINRPDEFCFLQQLEGGGFWFNHTIRDYVYAENTKYTNTEYLNTCIHNKFGDETVTCWRNAACQLFLTATTHQQIARAWYTRTFVQSQDTFAFLEYTYHRLSSIRCLAKLRALAQVAQKKQNKKAARAILDGIVKCGELMRLGAQPEIPFAQLIKQLDFEDGRTVSRLLHEGPDQLLQDAGSLGGLELIEAELRARHRRELSSLHRAWTRSEVTLRTQVPAEQLLNWCDELVKDDLVYRSNCLVISYENNSSGGEPGSQLPKFEPKLYQFLDERECRDADLKKDRECIDPDLEKDIEKFRHYLQDLQVKLWIERADYETCTRKRRQHLIGRLPESQQEELAEKYNISKEQLIESEIKIEEDKDFIASANVQQYHPLLDIVNCKLKSAQESTFSDKDLIKKRQGALGLIERIESQLETPKSAPTAVEKEGRVEADDLNEAWLRLLHLRAECQLGRVSMFAHNGFIGDPECWVPEAVDLEAARKTIDTGLLKVRAGDARTQRTPRSVVVDPTTDGALYLQYRSVFHMLHGRAEWLTKVHKDTGTSAQEDRNQAFQRAFRYFEMARGGLSDHSPLMSALIELYDVEAHLACARNVLFEMDRDAFDLARAMYESARGRLQRARKALLASRRNTIWRKLFFQLVTQYHSDRLLLGYAQLETRACEAGNDQSLGERLRQSLLRLRRAYQSLRMAVDHLPQAPLAQNGLQPKQFRWLYRMWWELTLCGYATGRLALETFNLNMSSKDLIEQLKWLNESAGLDASELGAEIREQYTVLEEKYEKILEIQHQEKQGMKRRRKLIELASEAAADDRQVDSL